MQPKTPNPPPSPQLTVTDIYYVLFKHKWMILIFSVLGLGAAAAVYFIAPPPYVSQAKLLVRYVDDSRAATGPGTDPASVKPINSQPEGVLESEANILTSLDVAGIAVDAVGATNILGKTKATSTNRELAALAIRKNLDVEVPRRGNVLEITYKNSDITIVQPVLRKVIDAYYKKHVEIHRNLGVLDNFLTEETDRLGQSLKQTEEDLRNLKTKAKVVSLDETRKVYADRYSKLRAELESAEAELSGRVAALKEMQKALGDAGATNAATTNATSEAKAKLSPELIAEYKKISGRLEAAVAQETELLKTYTRESSRVKEAGEKIALLEEQKKNMETANPRLIEEQVVVSQHQNPEASRRPTLDLTTEGANVAGLRARIATLTEQFNNIKSDAGLVDDIETSYLALQRKKEQQELQYKYYSRSLDQARVDSQLGTGKLSNVNEIQSPSLPMRDMKSIEKRIIGVAFGGIGGGIALAFLLELAFAQGIRKPSDLETAYNLPVFLTIPELDSIGKLEPVGLLSNGNGAAALPEPNVGSNGEHTLALEKREPTVEIAPWDEHHGLHPYVEALRDRLISFFELKGMTHKPKLVALTSCSKGAGVTTIAAGLAASLSETGEGNVLLVDMNLQQGAAHPFHRGKPACGLVDVLDVDKRHEAQVQENLYVVHGTGMDDRLPKMLPKRLAHLLPKLQASDYDYIIFDMPPVTQTSITPRLAGFMDMMFLVVEDEKTSREWIKQASRLLQQSKANIGAVFNKRRTYTPRWLHQEF